MHDAKSQLSRLVDRARQGEEVVIARNGEPVARLVAVETRPLKRRMGIYEGQYKVPEDFNDPLPEGFDGLS